jgi:hypothetical protein
MEYQIKFNLHQIVPLLFGFIFSLNISACKGKIINSAAEEDVQHVTVFYEEGKYGGWPANWGIWSWNNEILVGFTNADHKGEVSGHTYDVKTGLAKFARSLDGGKTWSIEDGYEVGITESTWEHNIGDKSQPAKALNTSIDFTHPDLALTLRARTLLDGTSSFYYSYDRGRNWEGAYKLLVDFPDREPAGIVTRTDYIIEGQHELTAFLTVGFREGDKNWREVAAVRTTDGGKTWKHLSWIGPKGVNSIMPSSVRLDASRIITTIRRTSPPEMVSFLTEDNGLSWTQLNDPVQVDANGHPPALLKLNDGRLCLVYLLRNAETVPEGIGVYVTFSNDNGQTWDAPVQLRGDDGANWDIGYPGAVQLSNGNVVAVYYYNNANDENSPPWRYIAATIFNPDKY